MEKHVPLVSVVMCTYNGERFLDEQIRSIIDQTYENMELIIQDDHSIDSTWSILQSWKEKHPEKIEIYQNETNVGLNKNFFKALGLAKGKYICVSDQDDIWCPQKISVQYDFMESNTQTILSYHREGKIINGQKEDLKPYSTFSWWDTRYSGEDVRNFFLYNVISGHQMMFRKEMFDRIDYFSNNYVYDYWLSLNALALGRVDCIEQELCYHRMHENSAWFAPEQVAKRQKEAPTIQQYINGPLADLYKLPNLKAQDIRALDRLKAALVKLNIKTNKVSKLNLAFLLMYYGPIYFHVKTRNYFVTWFRRYQYTRTLVHKWELK